MNALSQLDPGHGPGLPVRRTLVRRLNERFTYLLRLPTVFDPTRVLVTVHGISRNASFMLSSLGELAERHGYTLLAPQFGQRSFPDYQRLGRQGSGARADLALLMMLADARREIGIGDPVDLFGFSGGAQFAHRFAMAHPGVSRTVSLAAAGWYTDPGGRRRYPLGTRSTRRLPGLRFEPRGLLDTPTLVLVGDQDVERDSALRRRDWLDRIQGRTRLERARWFQRRLVRLADPARSVQHEFLVLDRTAHDFAQAVFNGDLATHLFEFCERHHPP